MNSRYVTALLTALLASAPQYLHASSLWKNSNRKSAEQTGRLEGTIATIDGVAVWEAGNGSGIHVQGISEDGRTKFDVASDTTMGGEYHVDRLPSGRYDLRIHEGYINGIPFRPQEIFDVEIKPNERTVLNIVMEPGDTLSIHGSPAYATPGAARAAEETAATGHHTSSKSGGSNKSTPLTVSEASKSTRG